MAFPSNWPSRHPSGRVSIRAFHEGTTSADFEDNAVMFAQLTSANPFKAHPYVAPGSDQPVVLGTINSGGQTPRAGGQAPQDVARQWTQADQAVPLPQIWPCTIMVVNNGAAAIEISFDGTNIHGRVKSGESRTYRERFESGISLRGVGGAAVAYWVEAW